MGDLRVADYGLAWRDYRKRRNLAILGLVWFFVGPVLLLRVLGHARLGSGWFFAALLTSGVVAVAPIVWLGQFRCPRCGGSFTLKGPWAQNIFARKCEQCGLAKYSNG
jgi:hypothetical protein